MKTTLFSAARLIICGFMVAALQCCSNTPRNVPFVAGGSGYFTPPVQALRFTTEKELKWTDVQGSRQPVIKHFDIHDLPAEPYGDADYKVFEKKPAETPFNLEALPADTISLSNLPSQPLRFKALVLPPPQVIKAGKFSARPGTSFSSQDFGIKQGLPGRYVTLLLKDRNGFIWMGTSRGLCRYDGEYIRIYVADNYMNTYGIIEDKQGRIWCLQQNGLTVLNPANGTLNICTAIKCHSQHTGGMFKDGQGRIWVAGANGSGVFEIEPDGNTFRQITWGSLPCTTTCVTGDSGNNLWIGTEKTGLTVINLITGVMRRITQINGLGSNSVYAVAANRQGSIWAVCGRQYVSEVNIAGNVIRQYSVEQGIANLSLFSPSSVLADERGCVWVAANPHGTEVLDPANGVCRYIDEKNTSNISLTFTFIADDYGRVWEGSISGINIITENLQISHLLDNQTISSLYEDAEGRIWAAAAGNGVFIIDTVKKILRHLTDGYGLKGSPENIINTDEGIAVTTRSGVNVFNLAKKTNSLIGEGFGIKGRVNSVLKDRHGNMWFVGRSVLDKGGVFLANASTGSLVHADISDKPENNYFEDMVEDKRGQIWLAGFSAPVNVLDLQNGIVKPLGNLPGADGQPRLLLADNFGRIWIGTGSGLYVVDKDASKVTLITTAQGLPDNAVSSLSNYNNSVIAATDRTVSIITPPPAGSNTDKWLIQPMYNSQGLTKEASTFKSNLVTAKGQFLWGDNGITFTGDIKPDTGAAATYVTGISVFNKEQYFVNPVDIPAADTSSAPGAAYAKGLLWQSVNGPYNMPVSLRLPHEANNIQFQFAQQHNGRPDAVQYCFILEGIDKQWGPVTTNTYTQSYYNLPAGHYTFKVTSKGTNGRWGQPAVFNFKVLPPWWQTWWACSLYVLGAGLFVWGFAYHRSKKLLHDNRTLENKIKVRTAEVLEQKEEIAAQRDNLEKTLQELQSTQRQLIQSEKMASLGELTAGIAHEIQNPLNFVNNFSEVNREMLDELYAELDKGNVEEAKIITTDIRQNEEKITHHGKRADAIVKGMLQHSRKNSGQKESTDINALVDEYLRLSYQGLRAKDKSFNAEINAMFDESLAKISIIPQDIGRVLLNLCNNAFYAVREKAKIFGGGYKPSLTVTTKKEKDKTIITVADNGNGIPEKIKDKIFQPFFTTKPTGEGTGLGLSLSYDIIKAHGGDIKMETKEGEGTTFTVTLPAHDKGF